MADANPYQSPSLIDATAVSVSVPSLVPLQTPWVLIAGAILGCVSFIFAIAVIPSDVASPSQHDLLLANYLGFVFPPLVGLWSGGVRRSWRWSVAGVAVGLAIGAAYYLVCGHNFLAIMVAFPCLLGGAASVALGSGSDSWSAGILARMGKGLVAGFVLGFVYMVVLNVLCLGWFPVESTERYHQMMWHNGPVAMSIASGVYLLLFAWASNLRQWVMTKRAKRQRPV